MTLSVRHLTIEYPGTPVFVDVNLEVANTELVAVISRVLDGGSSLLKGIGGLLNGVAGEVLLDGVDLLQEPGIDVVHRIGFVYEAYGLVSLFNVHTNIALPLLFHTELTQAEIDEQIDEVCRLLGLPQSIYALRPHQINDVQTRLVNLARALIVKPRLLLVDELEGGMNEDYLLATIDGIRHRQQDNPGPIIMTTMSDEIIAAADRVYSIEDLNLVQVTG